MIDRTAFHEKRVSMKKDAYHEYLQSDEWKSRQLLCLQRDGYRCRICNAAEALEVHHRTYERIGQEDPDDLTTLCDKCHRLYTEKAIGPGETVILHEAIKDAYHCLDFRKQRGENEYDGISSGFSDLDNLTAGFQGSNLILLASRPSVGKTAFALNIARHAAVEKALPVLFVSLVHTRVELADRLLCCQARIDSHRLRRGHLSHEDMVKVFAAGEILTAAKLLIDDTPAQGLLRIAANARRLKREIDIRLIIIDSLQAIDPEDRRGSRQEQVANISRRLKYLARELEIPIIVLAQLNRSSEDRQDHKPRLSDLRDSAPLEQDSDVAMLLHQEFWPEAPEDMMTLTVAKQRNGPTGEVSLTYAKQFMRFETFMPEHQGGFSDL